MNIYQCVKVFQWPHKWPGKTFSCSADFTVFKNTFSEIKAQFLHQHKTEGSHMNISLIPLMNSKLYHQASGYMHFALQQTANLNTNILEATSTTGCCPLSTHSACVHAERWLKCFVNRVWTCECADEICVGRFAQVWFIISVEMSSVVLRFLSIQL